MIERDTRFGTAGLLAVAAVTVFALTPAGIQEAEAAQPAAAAPEASPAAAPAAAIQEMDGGWLAWLGCWEPVAAPAEAAMRCVRPTAAGVELLTVEDGRVTGSRPLRADGVERPADREGCTGTERAEFSDDDRRIYRASTLTCGEIQRTTTRLWALVSPTEWIEVRSVEDRGREAASVERYRAAAPSRVEEAGLSEITEDRKTAVEWARLAASAPLTVGDVIEAVDAVGAEVVEAWIAERGEPLEELDADRLVRLADAGVPAEVIDVAVATSYPDRFQVERAPYGEQARRAPGGRAAYPAPWGHLGSWARYGAWNYRYSPYGSRFFDPYRYRYRHYGGPTIVVVRPADPGSDGGGRVISGQGYTGSRSDGATAPRSGSPIPNATQSPPASSGTSTGRKAKPRKGNGGSSGSGGSGSSSGSGSGGGPVR